MKIITLLFVLVLTACADSEQAVIESDSIRPAKILTIKNQNDASRLEYTARVEALQTIDVSFEVGGPLAQLPVREGVTVEKDSLLAQLDATDFQLDVREAEVQLKLAAQDLNRKKKVLKENGIAKSLVEDAQSNYDLQRVRLRQAKERLADTKITAPFEAYVSRRYMDNHVNVRAGDPIVKLHDLTQLVIVISLPENLLATLSAEQVAKVWAEFAFAPGQEFPMTYRENRGEADALAQTYEVTFTMDNPEQWNILPGMTATARFNIKGSDTGAIVVPASAIVPLANGDLSVWTYDPTSQQVSQQEVKTGTPTQSGVNVLSGLKTGDQIVITGANQLQAGMKVRPL